MNCDSLNIDVYNDKMQADHVEFSISVKYRLLVHSRRISVFYTAIAREQLARECNLWDFPIYSNCRTVSTTSVMWFRLIQLDRAPSNIYVIVLGYLLSELFTYIFNISHTLYPRLYDLKLVYSTRINGFAHLYFSILPCWKSDWFWNNFLLRNFLGIINLIFNCVPW